MTLRQYQMRRRYYRFQSVFRRNSRGPRERRAQILLHYEKYLVCEEGEIDAVDKAETFTRYKICTEEVYEYDDVLVIRACGYKCWKYTSTGNVVTNHADYIRRELPANPLIVSITGTELSLPSREQRREWTILSSKL